MRIGAVAHRKLSRLQGRIFLAPGLSLVSRNLWLRIISSTILPSGGHLWYKARDDPWWLGKIAHRAPSGPPTDISLDGPSDSTPDDSYIIPSLDDPGAINTNLQSASFIHYCPERHLRPLVFATLGD